MSSGINLKTNILLTGIPRSGTTLCCRFLNELEGTVALVEPFSVKEIAESKLAVAKIVSLIQKARLRAESGAVTSKLYDGQIAENIIAEKNQTGTPRQEQIEAGDISLSEPLLPSGALVVKHNAMFTALLSQLQESLPIYALIRNPLSVLASWSSVALPVGEGRVPAGELFSANLKERLDAEPDRLLRQLIILDWFFQCYAALPSVKVLRYEILVTDQHNAVKPMLEQVGGIKLKSAANKSSLENQNSKYDKDKLSSLAKTLLSSDGAYWNFYSREDVEALLVD